MAIAIESTFLNGTLDQYDDVVSKLGFHPGGPSAQGCLFHWVTKTDDGTRVVDVWESTDAFQRFLEEKLGPAMQEAGVAQPEVRMHEVHNYLTAG